MKNLTAFFHCKSAGLIALALLVLYSLSAPRNHSEAEDVYDFALRVEQGGFAEQAGVNRVLALPAFGTAYKAAQLAGYSGRAFPFMVFLNRLLAILCLYLFWKLFSSSPQLSNAPAPPRPYSLSTVLCLAFSYGFWRYANEAETYVLASALVLGSWCLAVKGRWLLCAGVSSLGILVHLLNLVPLLVCIPLYYLLCKEWKNAVLHGVLTGLVVLLGYAACFHVLDWGELGAQHHRLEGGLNAGNLLRGGVAFGQCLVSGNFLFGFEAFRELLVRLFPSRMLAEEFFMAAQMPPWIRWAGCITVVAGGCAGAWALLRGKNILECGGLTPLWITSLAWFLLHAIAVIRTEAGSPELWITALIPFWLVVATLLQGAGGRGQGATISWAPWGLVVALFFHNLVAGLLPVLAEKSDYHAAKGRWVVENSAANDLVLADYEPVMVFYLDYFSEARILNSGQFPLEEIEKEIAASGGNIFALGSFFEPMDSMRARSPETYAKMRGAGQALRPAFERIEEDEFGGIYKLKKEGEAE